MRYITVIELFIDGISRFDPQLAETDRQIELKRSLPHYCRRQSENCLVSFGHIQMKHVNR
jgi:hypothetical protein